MMEQKIASPPVWLIRLTGHIVTMMSLRDDSYEETTYEKIPLTFGYLSDKQLYTLKWLIEQGYEVIVDSGKKTIARKKVQQVDEAIQDLARIASGDIEQPDWYDALLSVEELAREQMWETVR